MPASIDDRLPAILGGGPVHSSGTPTWPLSDAPIAGALARLAETGDWGRYSGPHTAALERRLSELTGRRHVLLCASGTAAVELALRGVGVSPGGEVAASAYDFPGNALDICALGATPVLVDPSLPDLQFEVSRLAEAWSPTIQGVLVSHLHGGVVDLPAICAFSQELGAPVIEDACQMPLADVHGAPAGSWGDASVFSFGGSKLLSAGRGGAVLTDRDDVRQRIRLHTQRGNDLSPLSELQAAVLLPQLEQLPERRRVRGEFVRRMRRRLADVPGIQIPPAPVGSTPDYYKVSVWYSAAAEHFGGLPRDRFAAALRAEGFAIWPGFRSLDRRLSRRRFRAVGELTHAHRADEQLLVLHHPVLLWAEINDREVEGAGVDEVLDRLVLAIERIRAHAARLCAAPESLFASAAPWAESD
jgi:dTDP-4-amino-4,6-dideoxygalactose transaminase